MKKTPASHIIARGFFRPRKSDLIPISESDLNISRSSSYYAMVHRKVLRYGNHLFHTDKLPIVGILTGSDDELRRLFVYEDSHPIVHKLFDAYWNLHHPEMVYMVNNHDIRTLEGHIDTDGATFCELSIKRRLAVVGYVGGTTLSGSLVSSLLLVDLVSRRVYVRL